MEVTGGAQPESRGVSQLLLDLPGWLLMLLTFAVPVPLLRKNQPLLLAVWFTLGVHHCAAIVQCYVHQIPGIGDADAQYFHALASGRSPDVTVEPYVLALRFTYLALGASELLGCELSVLAYALSVLVFIQLIRWTEQETNAVPLVILFGCLPAAFFHRAVTLRESFQILAMLLVIECMTRISTNPRGGLGYLSLVASLAFLGALHNGLVVLALGLAFLGFLWAARLNPILTMVLAVPVSLVLLLTARPLMAYLEENSTAARALSQGQVLSMLENYREQVYVSRANYGTRLDTDSLDRFLLTFPPVMVNYLYAPFPWQATGLKDLYALLESAFRLALTWGLAVNLLRSRGPRRRRLLLLTAVFLLVESLWAVGSSNWGQAIRHRIVAYPFFLLVGAEPVLNALFHRNVAETAASPVSNGNTG